MTGRVKSDFTGRINKYVSYRRQAERSGSSFNEAMANRVGGQQSGGRVVPVGERAGSAPRAATQQGSGRRRVAGRQASHSAPKYISQVQATRLAQYAPIIQQAAQKYRVPVELVCAVILQESGGQSKAVSHCGARGLMQLMPGTAKRLGVRNSFDPVQNVMGGTKYLRMLMDRFDGNMALALAGYNAGEHNVEKYGRRIPPFRETQAYVPNVLKYADTLWTVLKQPVRRIVARPRIVPIQHRTIYSMPRRA